MKSDKRLSRTRKSVNYSDKIRPSKKEGTLENTAIKDEQEEQVDLDRQTKIGLDLTKKIGCNVTKKRKVSFVNDTHGKQRATHITQECVDDMELSQPKKSPKWQKNEPPVAQTHSQDQLVKGNEAINDLQAKRSEDKECAGGSKVNGKPSSKIKSYDSKNHLNGSNTS